MFPYGRPLLEQTTAAEASMRKSTGPTSPAGSAKTNGPPQSPVTLPQVMFGRGVSRPVWAYTRPLSILVQADAHWTTDSLNNPKSPPKATPAATRSRSDCGSPMSAVFLTNESEGPPTPPDRKNPK